MLDLRTARERLIKEARAYKRSPAMYYEGPEKGMDPREGFDCSGFPTFLLRLIGFPPDYRHVNEYFDRFGVFVQDGLQGPGDLVFFSWDGIYPRHMGIMVEPERYIHVHQGHMRIEERTLKRSVIRPSPSETRNIIYNRNPIGFKRLAVRNGRFHEIAPYPTG